MSSEAHYFQANKALWDAKTSAHVSSKFYDMEGFRAGKTSLKSIELNALADLDLNGKSILHLQCHFGQDSLSFARMGAQVTGVDLSTAAIQQARELTEELGLNARFIECNVLDLPQHLDEQFDLVFTSYGVLGWLPDMQRWAQIVAQFLKPDGIFYIAEFHPILYLYDFDKKTVDYPYFNTGKPFEEEVENSYTDSSEGAKGTEYFWQHGLAEVLQPLLNNGLNLLEFKEFDYSPYDCFPNLKKRAEGEYVLDTKHSLPHIFSLKMQKND